MRPLLVSLGGRCDVAWQIHDAFGEMPAFPFDWLVTPLQSIPIMVEENFCDIADARWLEPSSYIHPFDGRTLATIINTKYNVFLHHEFERSADGRIVADWRSTLDTVQQKWRFVTGRWIDLLQTAGEVVFFRRRGCFSMPDERDEPTTQDDFEAALTALRQRAPRCRMVVADAGCNIRHDSIVACEIGNPGAADWPNPDDYWKGATSAWRRAFSGTGLI